MKVIFKEKFPPKSIQKKIYAEAEGVLREALREIQSNPNIAKSLDELINRNERLEDILNYSALFSVMTGLSLEWRRRDTLVQLAVGSFLQKIGTTELREPCIELTDIEKEDPQAVIDFQRHPFFGARVMGTDGDFAEVAKQIVYQRHELYNGGGFPNGVSGFKIFPPARLVALCSDFSEILVTHDLSPLDALRKILTTAETASNYDPEFIRGLVGTFIKRGSYNKVKK